MTTGQLIELLSEYPKDLPVVFDLEDKTIEDFIVSTGVHEVVLTEF